MYFKEFPVVPYPYYIGDQRLYAIARNVLRRVALTSVIDGQVAFIEYNIKDGEKPEHIANRVYGNSAYHWLVLLCNNITDPYYGWYMSQSSLEQYIQKRYSGMVAYFSDGSGGFTYNTQFAQGCTLNQNGQSMSIKNYRDTFCEFAVETPAINVGSATVSTPSGSTATVYIEKVLPYIYGVHNFQLERPTGSAEGACGAQEFPVADPLSRQTADYEEYTPVLGNQYPALGVGGAAGATVQFWETYIGKYMGISGDEINSYAVSNYVYEQNTNDSKRTIRILNPVFLDQAMKELKAAMGV